MKGKRKPDEPTNPFPMSRNLDLSSLCVSVDVEDVATVWKRSSEVTRLLWDKEETRCKMSRTKLASDIRGFDPILVEDAQRYMNVVEKRVDDTLRRRKELPPYWQSTSANHAKKMVNQMVKTNVKIDKSMQLKALCPQIFRLRSEAYLMEN